MSVECVFVGIYIIEVEVCEKVLVWVFEVMCFVVVVQELIVVELDGVDIDSGEDD